MNKPESNWGKARKAFRLMTKALPIRLVDEDHDLSEMRNIIDTHSDDDIFDPFEVKDWVSVWGYCNISIMKSNDDDYSTSYNLFCVNKICSKDRVENYIMFKRSIPFKEDMCTCTYKKIGDSFRKSSAYLYKGKMIEEVNYYDLEGYITTIEALNSKPNNKVLAKTK